MAEKGFAVLPLDEAVTLLEEGKIPDRAVVITIDDGFYGTYKHAFPLLREFSFPATTYVTTYYASNQSPVFGLTVRYIFWKSGKMVLDLDGLGLERTERLSIDDPGVRDAIMEEIVSRGNHLSSNAERDRLIGLLGERLGVDAGSIVADRMLGIMNTGEIREMSEAGMDIQLHTHRHVFPENKEKALEEISDNRAVLEPLAGSPLLHFCYPSGNYSREQWGWLEETGIKSAVTCDLGLNYHGDPPMGLKRFLDADDISRIEFEAEMCGFGELLRGLRFWRNNQK